MLAHIELLYLHFESVVTCISDVLWQLVPFLTCPVSKGLINQLDLGVNKYRFLFLLALQLCPSSSFVLSKFLR